MSGTAHSRWFQTQTQISNTAFYCSHTTFVFYCFEVENGECDDVVHFNVLYDWLHFRSVFSWFFDIELKRSAKTISIVFTFRTVFFELKHVALARLLCTNRKKIDFRKRIVISCITTL